MPVHWAGKDTNRILLLRAVLTTRSPFLVWEYCILWPSNLPLSMILQNHRKELSKLFSLPFGVFLIIVSPRGTILCAKLQTEFSKNPTVITLCYIITQWPYN